MEILHYLTTRSIKFCYGHFHILLIDLVVLNAHEEVLHGGLGITLKHIRGKFWICQSRRVVNKVLRRSVVCKRSQGRTMKGLPPLDLPAYRLSFDYAFSNTGIDFAGPLYVKNVYSDDKDEMFKCYICLLTCATTRNVHLELSSSMDSSKVISCLKRFLLKRGCVNIFCLFPHGGEAFTSV